MSDLQIKRLQGRLTAINTTLNNDITTNVAQLNTQINELSNSSLALENSLNTQITNLSNQITEIQNTINDVKDNSYYQYAITAECEGAFTQNGLLNLSYGGSAPNEQDFALYVSHTARIERMTFMSVWGPNEVINPEVQLTINVYKYPENVLMMTYPFPNVAHGEPVQYHTGFTSQQLYLDINFPGVMIYVTASHTNLQDPSNRHRLTFEFKKNLF